MLLIIFVLMAGHWEFSKIVHINGFDSQSYCERSAIFRSDSYTRAFCMDDAGVEA